MSSSCSSAVLNRAKGRSLATRSRSSWSPRKSKDEEKGTNEHTLQKHVSNTCITQLANMSIGPTFAELTADVVSIELQNTPAVISSTDKWSILSLAS